MRCTGYAQMQQAAAASQLLRELESLTEEPDAAGEPLDETGYREHSTPALGITNAFSARSMGTCNTRKRQRKTQLVSVLGSQEMYFSSQQPQDHADHNGTQQENLEVDLQTPPWLQQSEPRLDRSNDSTHRKPYQAASLSANVGAALGVRTASSVDEKAVACREQVIPHFTQKHCLQLPLQQGASKQQTMQQLDAHEMVTEEEDAICDSDDNMVPIAPGARRLDAHCMPSACHSAATTPVGAWGTSQHQQVQPDQQQLLHTSLQHGARALHIGRSTPQQEKQSRKRSSALLTTAQHQSQQARLPRLLNAEATLPEAQQDDWMPPKYCSREQQQLQHTQLPLGASKHPSSRPSSTVAASTAAHAPSRATGPGGLHVGDAEAPCTASSPWWLILDDFTPVEVLMQEAVNPRDGAIVHVNYKSQFKDGVTAVKRGSTAAGANAASRRRRGAGNASARHVATTGTAGFCTAEGGAAAVAETKSRGKRRRSGRAASGAKRKAQKAKGSGGKRKRAGGQAGRWRWRNGRKVFIDAAGKQLTGSAAWGRYQQSKGT